MHHIFRSLLDYDLETESIFSLLHRETNYRLGNAQQSIDAVIAGPAESKLLNVEPGSPLLLMKRLIALKNDVLFQYSGNTLNSVGRI